MFLKPVLGHVSNSHQCSWSIKQSQQIFPHLFRFNSSLDRLFTRIFLLYNHLNIFSDFIEFNFTRDSPCLQTDVKKRPCSIKEHLAPFLWNMDVSLFLSIKVTYLIKIYKKIFSHWIVCLFEGLQQFQLFFFFKWRRLDNLTSDHQFHCKWPAHSTWLLNLGKHRILLTFT